MGKNPLMMGDTQRKSHVLPHIRESQKKHRQENNTRIFKSRKSKVDKIKRMRQIRNELSGYKLLTGTQFI